MHIADGILSGTACALGYAGSLTGVCILGRNIEAEEVVRMGLIASAVFVISTFHFPLGGTSIHLGLYGLAGILLGRRAFPVIFTTLLFQALLFQHGGIISLGVNALNMGVGALAAAAVWRLRSIPEGSRAVAAGFLGAILPAAMMALEFYLSGYGKGFSVIASLYSIVALIEGAVTSFIVIFLRKVKPAVLARVAA